MNEYIAALKNYAVFSGKATRRDYWMFVLVNLIIAIAITFLGSEILNNLYSLALLVPGLAIGARRLHDINRTGWWQLLWVIPVLGWIVLLIFFIQPSAEEAGEQPQAAPTEPQDNTLAESAAQPEEGMTDSEDMQGEQSEENTQ